VGCGAGRKRFNRSDEVPRKRSQKHGRPDKNHECPVNQNHRPDIQDNRPDASHTKNKSKKERKK